jgi:large subunit ribosomal protein L10
MIKADKVTLVEKLSSELTQAKSLVVINYTGLSVKSQQELKKRLETVGAKMVVIKNTLLKRAGEAAKLDAKLLSDEVLSGQTALVITQEDPIAFIQVLGKFTKEFEIPKMKIGLVDGTSMEAAELTRIAALPNRETLLSQVLGSLMSSPYGLVATLQGNLQKLVYVLSQKAG